MPTAVKEHTFEWVGTIITASGAEVSLTDFAPSMCKLFDIATALANTGRYNGHTPKGPYSVAEHSVRVANWLGNEGFDATIQMTGLLHDAAEAYIGDMVRPLKRHPAMVAFMDFEAPIERVIHDELGGIYPHPDIIKTADLNVYEWEVANIRTGKVAPWTWNTSRRTFLETHKRLKIAMAA